MKKWFVLYTKPNREKKMLPLLTNIGIVSYCPMVATVRQWSDRKKKIQVPIIPSVIFIQCLEKDRNKVFQIPGAHHYLFWLGKPAVVKDSEIQTMKDWLNGEVNGAKVEELKTGDTYIIKSNGFIGQEGIVNEVSNNRIQVILKELGIKITLTRDQLN